MIGALLGPIGSVVSTWLEGRNQKIKAETETRVAIAKSRAEIAKKLAAEKTKIKWHINLQPSNCGTLHPIDRY